MTPEGLKLLAERDFHRPDCPRWFAVGDPDTQCACDLPNYVRAIERGRPMDDPGLRSAPAGRIESAARIVVHHYGCMASLDDCQICAALADRSSETVGSLDVAIADLEAALLV